MGSVMSEMEITREDVAGRARAEKLAPHDVDQALRIAWAIKHPWYRCQALSIVAQHMSGSGQERVLESALAVALEQDEINRIVTVSSWPIRGLVKAGAGSAGKCVRQRVALATNEPHNLRQAHALQALASAVYEDQELLAAVVPALARALLGGRGPRIDRCIRDTLELIQCFSPDLARTVAMHHKPSARRTRLLHFLAH